MPNPPKTFTVEDARRLAARAAVDAWVDKTTQIIGIGSGPTVEYAIERLAEMEFENPQECRFICMPGSTVVAETLQKHKLKVGNINLLTDIDVTITGADEIDQRMMAIKSTVGCMLREKVLAYNSKNVIIVADYHQKSLRLGEQWCNGIAVEVTPLAWVPVRNHIKHLFGGEVTRRMGPKKLAPLMTENNNYLLDWLFQLRHEYSWPIVNHAIQTMPGVVSVGLVVSGVTKTYFGMADGSIYLQSH